MKPRSALLASVSAAIVLLMLTVGLSLAQGPGPGTDRVTPTNPDSIVPGAIPIQGRLTDAGGAPLNGTYTMTFRFYDVVTATVAVCSDVWQVAVTNGLFSDYLDGCYNDITGQKLWLGIQVGSDAEMTPRQVIYPVPYAISLVPGAVISTGDVYPVLEVVSTHASGRALRSYALATSGTNYGIVAASSSPGGYGGYFYDDSGGVGVFGRGDAGIIGEGYGVPGAHGVVGRAGAFATGVKGEGNISSYGGWFTSTDNIALYITSNREDNTNALVLDGKQDGNIDFNVASNGNVEQALTSNGLVKAGVNAYCGNAAPQITRSFNNVGGTMLITGTAAGQCTINFGFDVYDRFFVATSASNTARFVSCNTAIGSKNELYCRNYDAAGAGQDGAIMILIY